jgi:hypothetical protein
MNERIKALAEQAGYEKDMFGVGHWDMPECQKFAELIIQECAEIADTAEPFLSSDLIKNHFGIK